MPESLLQICLDSLMHHSQLVSELALSAGLIQHAQGILPEASSNRQKRIILDEEIDVILPMTDGRA